MIYDATFYFRMRIGTLLFFAKACYVRYLEASNPTVWCGTDCTYQAGREKHDQAAANLRPRTFSENKSAAARKSEPAHMATESDS